MEETGCREIGDYILKMKKTVAQYIETRPIMELWNKKVRRPGDWFDWRCWEQEGIGLAGAMVWEKATADREEESGGEETDR